VSPVGLPRILAGFISVLPGGAGVWIKPVLNIIWTLAAIFLAYRGFHALLRIKGFNRLFTTTTFTHYWGRYREPDMNFHDALPGDSTNRQIHGRFDL